MPTLERFVVLMYDRSSTCTTVNDAHKETFAHKDRPIEAIPQQLMPSFSIPREPLTKLNFDGLIA